MVLLRSGSTTSSESPSASSAAAAMLSSYAPTSRSTDLPPARGVDLSLEKFSLLAKRRPDVKFLPDLLTPPHSQEMEFDLNGHKLSKLKSILGNNFTGDTSHIKTDALDGESQLLVISCRGEKIVDHVTFQVPRCLRIAENCAGGGRGVKATMNIPRKTFLGFYDGKRIDMTEEEAAVFDSWYLMEVESYERKQRFYLDAKNPLDGNWTRYVNCATSHDEESIEFLSFEGGIALVTRCDISAGKELLVWYGAIFGPLIAGEDLYDPNKPVPVLPANV